MEGDEGAEREHEVTKSEGRMEGFEVNEDVVGAQKDVADSCGSGVLGRAEELERKSAPGWTRKGIRPLIEMLFVALNTIES
jgi:hypothetical protein